MDNTPISNYLNAQLAIVLNDPVGGTGNDVKALTDGSIFRSSDRNRYLCSAFREIVNVLVGQNGIDMSAALLQGLTQSVDVDLSGSVDVPGDYMYPHSFMVGTQEYDYVTHHSELIQDLDPWLGAGYTIDGGKFYPYLRTSGVWALKTTGTATFDYIRAGRVNPVTGIDLAVNEAPDVETEPKLYNSILYFAAARACADKADSPVDSDSSMKSRSEEYYKRAVESLPKPAEQN